MGAALALLTLVLSTSAAFGQRRGTFLEPRRAGAFEMGGTSLLSLNAEGNLMEHDGEQMYGVTSEGEVVMVQRFVFERHGDPMLEENAHYGAMERVLILPGPKVAAPFERSTELGIRGTLA